MPQRNLPLESVSEIIPPELQGGQLSIRQKIASKLREEGFTGLLRTVARRVIGWRLPQFDSIVRTLDGKTGIEIGGPSSHFFAQGGPLPIYPIAARIDNCNFSNNTVWEGSIEAGRSFKFDASKEPGQQFVCEAKDLPTVVSSNYDFLLSSHTIEHLANPLGALMQWQRILKPGATLILIVPHGEGTFDHRRPFTPLDHIVDDCERNTGEDDMTHYDEIVALHDRSMDIYSGDLEFFTRRSRNNFKNRCLHHHVFNTRSFVALLDRAGLQLRQVRAESPVHIIVAASTVAPGQKPDNVRFLALGADYLRRSPFRVDRPDH
jgi:SAM-dependent methyltransferase